MRKGLALIALLLCLLLCAAAQGEALYQWGDSGEEIYAIKQRMLELGYYTGKIDTKNFNKTMIERVKQLQQMNGLEETGEIDAALYTLLMSDAVIMKNGQRATTGEPSGIPYPTPTPAPERILFREGSAGEAVWQIKQRLYELGYYTTPIISSAYNVAMTERICLLQKRNGLTQTGVISESLYALLFSEDVLGAEEQGDLP